MTFKPILAEFEVLLEPIPASRPRWDGKNRRTYNKDKYTRFKDHFRIIAGGYRPTDPHEGPLRLVLEFRLRAPKYVSGPHFKPDKKPDIDNLIKGVMDAMNTEKRRGLVYYSGFWNDDAQVVDLVATKRYAMGNEDKPSISVRLQTA